MTGKKLTLVCTVVVAAVTALTFLFNILRTPAYDVRAELESHPVVLPPCLLDKIQDLEASLTSSPPHGNADQEELVEWLEANHTRRQVLDYLLKMGIFWNPSKEESHQIGSIEGFLRRARSYHSLKIESLGRKKLEDIQVLMPRTSGLYTVRQDGELVSSGQFKNRISLGTLVSGDSLYIETWRDDLYTIFDSRISDIRITHANGEATVPKEAIMEEGAIVRNSLLIITVLAGVAGGALVWAGTTAWSCYQCRKKRSTSIAAATPEPTDDA